MTLSIIVPCRPDGGHRDRAWQWIEKRWRTIAPAAEIVTADSDGDTFSYAQAANRAVAKSSGDVLLFSGLELTVDALWLATAFELAQFGEWVLPNAAHYLTEKQSEALLSTDPVDPIAVPLDADWSGGSSVGFTMVPRMAFNVVGGYDERHTGWGWEDICFAAALRTLWRPEVRIPGDAFHLWHPTTHEATWIQPNCDDQKTLWRRYRDAEGRPGRMRKLIAER